MQYNQKNIRTLTMNLNKISLTENMNFSAMRNRAARVLIMKASELPEKDRIRALSEINDLSKRAKYSTVLDIDAYSEYNMGVKNGLRFLDVSSGEAKEIAYIPMDSFVKSDETHSVMVNTYEDNPIPLETFMDNVKSIFSRKEIQLLDSMSQIERLERSIMGMAKDPGRSK